MNVSAFVKNLFFSRQGLSEPLSTNRGLETLVSTAEPLKQQMRKGLNIWELDSASSFNASYDADRRRFGCFFTFEE